MAEPTAPKFCSHLKASANFQIWKKKRGGSEKVDAASSTTLTLSLPRVINVKFLLQPHQNITSHSMKNIAFHSVLRWKMIILPILTTSLIHFTFLNLGVKGWNPLRRNSNLSARTARARRNNRWPTSPYGLNSLYLPPRTKDPDELAFVLLVREAVKQRIHARIKRCQHQSNV